MNSYIYNLLLKKKKWTVIVNINYPFTRLMFFIFKYKLGLNTLT